MIYFANPSTVAIRDHIAAGNIGTIRTPNSTRESQTVPKTPWIADNGCYTDNWNQDRWWNWLQTRTDITTCVFATAPDVVGDAEATAQLTHWLPRIRELGYPAAYAAQDGSENYPPPWDDFDVLFIGGTNNFKLGPHARTLIHEAHQHGKWVHCGRINSLKRYRAMRTLGVDSCDGTFLTFGPDRRLPELLSWTQDHHHNPPLFDLAGQP